MDKIAPEHGATVTQVALARQVALPWVTAPIVGANTVAQLGELVGACAVKLSAQQIETLDAVSGSEP
jgi:aryl-alcohol dehydrogenase-like predicted oxidoreductase